MIPILFLWTALLVLPWLLITVPAAAQGAIASAPGAAAAEEALTASSRYEVGFQATWIGQKLFRFRSPYEGKNSFLSANEGARWRRPKDHLAAAVVVNGVSAAHRDYLAAGGLGFQLGDGRLRYGAEQIIETYYSYQLSKPLALSLDYQFLNHPGYNRDRGPASVLSFRAHLEF